MAWRQRVVVVGAGFGGIAVARALRKERLEVAEQETAGLRRRELLTFGVIGGGPTGVEMAGALSELVSDAGRARLSTHPPRGDPRDPAGGWRVDFDRLQ